MEQSKEGIRKKVAWFSELMEKELVENIYKGGWDDANLLWLQARLSEELGELSRLLVRFHWPTGGVISGENTTVKRRAIEEAADVANFAMMIADILQTELRDVGEE
jgi:NTP pyrophosphatase (non-canonical NTP hydrolase)